jgi:hypothetical protein
MKKLLLLIVLVFLVAEIYPQSKKNGKNKTTISYNFQSININQWEYWVSNMGQAANIQNGLFSTSYPGAFWPGSGQDPNKSPIGDDGLIWIGKIDNKIVTSRADIRAGGDPFLQAGKIFDDGTPSNPKDNRYRVYKIMKGWESTPISPERNQFEKDYNEWPAEDGAPWVDVDGDGVFFRGVDQPQYLGDEVLWWVSNDMDTTILPYNWFNMNPLPWSAPQPIGLEVQNTLYGFNSGGDLSDLINYQYRIINKSGKEIKDMYLLYQSFIEFDPSSYYRGSGTCYIGVDTLLNLAYGYSIKNQTPNYNIPPAVGHKILQGPIVPGLPGDSAKFKGRWIKGYKNIGMNSFSFWMQEFDSVHFQTNYTYPPYFNNVVNGLFTDGEPIIDPISGKATKFILSGDPVNKTGWYAINGWPPGGFPVAVPSFMSDYYFTIGPFNMAPFDTQEVVIGIIGAVGTDNLNSITELKRKAAAIQKAYDHDFITVTPPPAPVPHSYSDDQDIILHWDDNAENYKQGDPLLYGRGFNDTTYNFEGYRVWQYKDANGNAPVNLAVYDIKDFISEIDDYKIVNGVYVKVPVIIGPDEGLRRYITITQDAYTKQPLRNGNSYYFGVTAYAYSNNSSPTYLESAPQIIEVKPGKQKIDYTSDYVPQQNVTGTQTSGKSDGQVIFKVIDPSAITNDDYEVVFSGIVNNQKDSLVYTLINVTRNDTLIKKSQDFTSDSLHKSICDGLMVIVNDTAKGSIEQLPFNKQPYRIKSVEEIAGKDGKILSNPQNVFYHLNSTQKWMIITQGDTLYPMENIDINNGAEYNDYEIRFTDSGSEYYTTGYSAISPLIKTDPRGKGKVPFEIWNKGADGTLNMRMFIKTWDRVLRDSMWTKDSISKSWEAIYGYIYDDSTQYVEPISTFSKPLALLSDIKIGNIILNGELPDIGTVIKISTFKRMLPGMKYHIKLNKAQFNNIAKAKTGVNDITVFPNPYFGSNSLETSESNKFMRFTRLPTQTTIRIYSLAGVYVRKLEKNDNSQYMDWDLRNDSGQYVASGMYIAYVEMPGAGSKVLKLAVIMEKEHLNKF